MYVIWGAGMVCYADIWVQVSVRYAGRAGGTEGKLVAMVARGKYWQKSRQRDENGAKRAENRGVVDILYEGFRKCFVNCKFTFYITLSSYYKKVKISKTSKNHSKM